MAASMIWKGLCRARSLCAIQHELETMHTLHRQHLHVTQRACRHVMQKEPKKKKYLQEKPEYDIYVMEDYPPQKYTFEQCVEMHKEAAQPAMANTLHMQVYADIELNFNTTKKTKFMKNIRGLLEFPHKFVHDQKKTIYVFNENESEYEMLKKLGASTVGGDDLIGYIKQGVIRKDDIESCDFIFSTPAMAVKLLKLRSVLMDKTPTLNNGCIMTNFEQSLKRHMEGVKYKSHKIKNDTGNVQIPFGQLNQDIQSLEDNFKYMITTLTNLKSPKQEPLLKSMRLIAPPSTEIFEFDLDAYSQDIVSTGISETVEDSDDED